MISQPGKTTVVPTNEGGDYTVTFHFADSSLQVLGLTEEHATRYRTKLTHVPEQPLLVPTDAPHDEMYIYPSALRGFTITSPESTS